MNIYWKLKRPPKMFLATISRNGKEYTSIYYDFETLYKDTFSPEAEIVNYIPLQVSGRNYQEKQNSLRETAIEFSNAELSDMSYSEWAAIGSFFETNGRRYGLLKEFRENTIC